MRSTSGPRWRSASDGVSEGELQEAERGGGEHRAEHGSRLGRRVERVLGGVPRLVDVPEVSEQKTPHSREDCLLRRLSCLKRDLVPLFCVPQCLLPVACEPTGCCAIPHEKRNRALVADVGA